MRVILFMGLLAALVLVSVACGNSAPESVPESGADPEVDPSLVAKGTDASGREFGLWSDDGNIFFIGWTDEDKDSRFYLMSTQDGKVIDAILMDCDRDNADDLVVIVETETNHNSFLVLHGSLFPDSTANAGASRTFHGINPPEGGFKDATSLCNEYLTR